MRRLVQALRGIAIAIAVAGAVDPACVTARAGRPIVAVLDAGAPDLAGDVRRRLEREYDVHSGALAGAAATVMAGDRLPADPPAIAGALVAVSPVPPPRRIERLTVVAPVDARPGSVAPIDVTLETVGLAGRTVRVELQDVTRTAVAADRVDRAVTADGPVTVRLSAPVIDDGAMRLAVTVREADAAAPLAAASVVVDVVARPWRVALLDGRPSWPATFVRRALEADARFAVAARVATSRGRAAVTGEATDLAAVDVVVVGAPEALDAATTRMLERAARARGVAIVLLVDAFETGTLPALAGGGRVREVQGVQRRMAATSRGTLVGTTFAVPSAMPPGAAPLASLDDGAVVVWQAPLGAGRVIVNGALDAWRYREREGSGFATFWRAVIAEAAAAVPPAIAVWPHRRLSAPGAPVDVRVVVRDAQLSDPAAASPAVSASAVIRGGTDGTARTIRLWPTPERGVLAGVVNAPGAPLAPGTYVIEARCASAVTRPDVSTATLLIAADAPAADRMLASWATSRGGVAVVGADAAAAALASRVRAMPPAPSRIMRAVWWLPVFLLVVGVEWWMRRYYGLTP